LKNIDVLLIHPSTLIDEKKAMTSIMANTHVGYGLLSIGTVLKKNGFSVEVWNIPLLYYQGFSKENLISIFKRYNPLIIGIELNWIHFSKGALEWAKLLKEELPNTKIIVGGVHQNIILYMLKNDIKQFDIYKKYIDAFFIGEAEKSLLEYVQTVKKLGDATKIKGTIALKNGGYVNNGPPNIFKNIDDIPPYDLRILRPKLSVPFDLAMINTCRGPCNFSCIYCIGNNETYKKTCISPRNELTFHSPKWIIAQIKYILRGNDSIALSIQDYIYSSPKKVHELALEIQKHPEIQEKVKSFNFAAIPGTLNNEIINELSKASVDSIDIGVETGSEKILRVLRRPYRIQQVKDTVKNCSRNGIIPKTYWMVGLPQETREDLELTKKLILETIELGGIPSWITPVCIFPPLEIYENSKKYGISPRFSCPEHYFIFSESKRTLRNSHAQVITHKTGFMNYEQIINASNELKNHVIKLKQKIMKVQLENLENYSNYHSKFNKYYLTERIHLMIENIKNTFF